MTRHSHFGNHVLNNSSELGTSSPLNRIFANVSQNALVIAKKSDISKVDTYIENKTVPQKTAENQTFEK